MIFTRKRLIFALIQINQTMIKNLSQDTIWIGADDLDLDLFESQYIVPEGISYNSYLILDSKIAILDTVDLRKADEWKANLQQALSGRQPDYLVVHHLEPDHSALIGWAMEQYPGLCLVSSAKALQMLPQFFQGISLEGRSLCINEGDTLELGKHSLRFFAAPMVHWPEVMLSYDEYEKSLFAADAFGKFGALSKCGFYGRDDSDWACEARRYYFNIVGKFGQPVQTLLKKLSGLEINSIRALHGPILEDNLAYYLNLYDTWSSYKAECDGIFIACASIHGGTMDAARKMAEILKHKTEKKVVVSDLCRSDFAENIEDAFKYSTLLLCASSYDGSVFSPMYDFLHKLQIKGYCKRRVGILENGSWAPSAARTMKELLSQMKEIELIEPYVSIRSRMKETDLPAMEELANNLLK